MMERGVIIVAGGSGKRMGSGKPKQYLDLAGKPVILHTLERFLGFDPHMKIVLVLAPDHRKYWDAIAGDAAPVAGIQLAEGGRTRYDSVKNGLEYIHEGIIVGIHDAVRPLVNRDTLERCYDAAEKHGSGVPVTAIEETVRMLQDGGGSVHMDRSKLVRVQTPQVFRSEKIKKAFNQPFDPAFTDDASVFESLFGHVNLVDGNPENIKITGPADLQLAAMLMRT